MQKRSLVDSFNCAIEGFIYVIKTQRHMRVHIFIGAFFILLGVFLNFTKVELLLLCISVAFVWLTEMINTAVEMTMDLVVKEFHPVARIIKDITAGAVLVSSLNAIIVGYLLFLKPIVVQEITLGIDRISSSPWHITFICLIVVLVLVILGKILFHKGTPVRGGMPSGHAALAFSIWTITIFITKNDVIIVLVLLMALLLARSRLEKHIHNIFEVIAGSLLGILTTTLIFQIMY